MTTASEVAELLELAGYSIKSTSLPPGYVGSYLEVSKATSTGITSRTVACINEPTDLNLLLRSPNVPRGSWVVVPDEMPAPLSPGLLRYMGRRKLEVLTLTLFYDRMLRARDICSKTLESTVRWKDQDIGLEQLSHLYVPQRATVIRDSREEHVNDSSVFVSSTLRSTPGAVTLILADAGRGKTWLTWSLAYDAAKMYLDATSVPHAPKAPLPPIPFLIPFSQYKRLTSFDGIILERLNSFGTLDIRAQGFKHLLGKGRIVLVLDGFDEMLELAPAHARENLLEIGRHLHGLSKLVLTSRRTVFPTKNEIG